jgi:DNA polymerase III epsilon subunit-like protein
MNGDSDNGTDSAKVSLDDWDRAHKGRLRKLWRKATETTDGPPSTTLTGILRFGEYNELRDLMERKSSVEYGTTPPGCTIRQSSKMKKISEKCIMEAHEQRAILHALLIPSSSSEPTAKMNKRARTGPEQSASPDIEIKASSLANTEANDDLLAKAAKLLPLGVNIHNPTAVRHVAVVEIHLNAAATSEKWTDTPLPPDASQVQADVLQLVQDVQETVSANVKPRHVWSIPTQWYAGIPPVTDQLGVWAVIPHPKSIADTLMYTSPSAGPKPSKAAKSSQPRVTTLRDLYARLHELRLTPHQLCQEGYPRVVDATFMPEGKQSDFLEAFVKPSSIPLATAKEYVRTFQVQVEAAGIPLPNSLPSTTTSDEPRPNNPSQATLAPFVSLPVLESSTSPLAGAGRIFAIDCEMVQTLAGSELARITLIQVVVPSDSANGGRNEKKGKALSWESRVVWDELVLPQYQVTNYLTEFSGMTAAVMATVETRIEQVQAALLQSIRPDDIVIGHSLENDLLAARWVHPTIVDTAILFRPTARGHTFKLKLRNLAQMLLGRSIQQRNHAHCSTEDAKAACELAVRRALEGPSFGMRAMTAAGQSGRMNQLEVLSRQPVDNTVVCVGPAQWLQRHVTSSSNGIHALAMEHIAENSLNAAVSWLTSTNQRRARATWSRISIKSPGPCATKEIPAESSDLAKLLDFVRRLVLKTSESDTVILVAIQYGLDHLLKLCDTRRVRNDPRITNGGWNAEDESRYRETFEASRLGHTLWISAPPYSQPA